MYKRQEQGSSMGTMTSSGRSIELDFQGTDYDVLRDDVQKLTEELRKRDDVMQVHSSVENAAPIVHVEVLSLINIFPAEAVYPRE